MNDIAKKIIDTMQSHMDKSISHLETELAKIRAGKANPQMLESIHVDYYGSQTPLHQVANVNTPDARTIVIQPWEKGMLGPIEKAIQIANLGFNPQNDGSIIRIAVPPLTEERRKDLVKRCKAEGENAKISLRSIRKEANDAIKKELKKGITEDEAREAETKFSKQPMALFQKLISTSKQKRKKL